MKIFYFGKYSIIKQNTNNPMVHHSHPTVTVYDIKVTCSVQKSLFCLASATAGGPKSPRGQM